MSEIAPMRQKTRSFITPTEKVSTTFSPIKRSDSRLQSIPRRDDVTPSENELYKDYLSIINESKLDFRRGKLDTTSNR